MPLYNPATPATDATLTVSDITTNDASTSKHGFLKKLDNSSTHFMDGQGNWSTPSGAGIAGVLLGLTTYRKASDAAIANITSATSVDVDAANLQVTFTAPASTNVLVRFTCYVVNSTAAKSDYWQVRESTTVLAEELVATNETGGKRLSVVVQITGIGAGSHTYKWGAKTSGGSHDFYGGPTFGSAVMEVWAAP